MWLIVAMLACPAANPPTPAPEPVPAPAPPAPAPAEPAPTPIADSPCVKACMDGRMMQAVGIDKIRSDCEVECKERPEPPI